MIARHIHNISPTAPNLAFFKLLPSSMYRSRKVAGAWPGLFMDSVSEDSPDGHLLDHRAETAHQLVARQGIFKRRLSTNLFQEDHTVRACCKKLAV